ncbi:hypothetical protein ACFV29_35590 [Streptomyces sp. NPDC059690]|uniref:hypothetical protein n=1 Tax=Streptomyces sp. NPDC059690 TaxID=3346907 RepID=UPI0036871232
MVVKDTELPHLRRRVEPAAEAPRAGDEPFGSLPVGGDGTVLDVDHNPVASGERPRPPKSELARWAAARPAPWQRAPASTAGCARPRTPGRVGLARIVYTAASR